MKWKGKLIDSIYETLKEDSLWGGTAERILTDPHIGIHLAVFNEPFLALIYKGEKKIESRFSINQISPFNKIVKGDIVIMKSSGGPISGIFLAGEVYFFSNFSKEKAKEIEKKYGKSICTHYDPNFWASRTSMKYASLIKIEKLKALTPFKIEKKDRLAWSTIRLGYSHNLLL